MKTNLRSLKTTSLLGLLTLAGVSSAAFAGVIGVPSAFAQASPQATARARAVIKDSNGATRGTILVTEYMDANSEYVDHRIDVTGLINAPLSVLAAGSHGLHVWEGTCDALGGHLDLPESNTHPQHTGDLPNVTVVDMGNGTGRASIRFTKITNRFGISYTSYLLNAWDSDCYWFGCGMDIAIGIDAGPASELGSDEQPLLCGELNCDDSGNCYGPGGR